MSRDTVAREPLMKLAKLGDRLPKMRDHIV
jgi:hypothetical protein